MTRRLVAAMTFVGVLVAMNGCTREVRNPVPRPADLAAPISADQVADLLSPKVLGEDGNLFVTAEPERCRGLAQEVDPPLLHQHRPLATDGGHWTTSDGATFVEEMVAVYRFDFDPVSALEEVRRTIANCGDTALHVTTMLGRTYTFSVSPAGGENPPNSVGWSLAAADWNCQNTFVAAHNAAIEITACGSAADFNTAALAEDALKRLDSLANTAA